MLKKKHFRYRDIDALRTEIAELGLNIRLEEKIEKLLEPVQIGHKVAGNAFGIHPMEGVMALLTANRANSPSAAGSDSDAVERS